MIFAICAFTGHNGDQLTERDADLFAGENQAQLFIEFLLATWILTVTVERI